MMKQAMIQNVAVGEGCRGVAHKWDETVGRSKFCWRKRREKRGCAHGGSWRERDASLREKTLPRLGMGEDATGGGRVCGAIACSTDVEVKLTPAGLYLTACIYCTASTSQNTARMEVRERASGSRAAALPSHVVSHRKRLPCANIYREAHVVQHGCLNISTWSKVK
jgi:hypothetical protein